MSSDIIAIRYNKLCDNNSNGIVTNIIFAYQIINLAINNIANERYVHSIVTK